MFISSARHQCTLHRSVDPSVLSAVEMLLAVHSLLTSALIRSNGVISAAWKA